MKCINAALTLQAYLNGEKEQLRTGTLGSRPSRKLLMVPNSPSCQMGNASVSTLVRFSSSSCAAAASICAHTASRSFCTGKVADVSRRRVTELLKSACFPFLAGSEPQAADVSVEVGLRSSSCTAFASKPVRTPRPARSAERGLRTSADKGSNQMRSVYTIKSATQHLQPHGGQSKVRA